MMWNVHRHSIIPLILVDLLSSSIINHGGHGVKAQEVCGDLVTQPIICEVGQCIGQSHVGCSTVCDQMKDDTSPIACRDATFVNGFVDCSLGACTEANFVDSTVECTGSFETFACLGSEATRSNVICNERLDCIDSNFLSSAVTCNGSAADSTCNGARFARCSCCDGIHCPETAPSCSNDVVDFCSTLFLSTTCKEWGNPVCQDIDAAPSGGELATICENGACIEATFEETAVVCDNFGHEDTDTRTCREATFSNTLVECEYGGCESATFHDAVVDCLGDFDSRTCSPSTFNLTQVTCSGRLTCLSSNFLTSAVTCDGASGHSTCQGSRFARCSCCDGNKCPESMPSCEDDVEGFCSSLYLGRTCKEWGNPICNGVTTSSSGGAAATICEDGGCIDANFENTAVVCDNFGHEDGDTRTCREATFSNTLVECEYGGCQSSTFHDALVDCLGDFDSRTCSESTFNRTEVICSGRLTCLSSQFLTSAVSCDGSSGQSTCQGSRFARCSCCDGNKCPDDVPSCGGDFCTTETFAGLTCAEWGNPACSSLADTDVPSESLTPPPTASPILTMEPSRAPTAKPSQSPVTSVPSATPTFPPQMSPTESPVNAAIEEPSNNPTMLPSLEPTAEPPGSPSPRPTLLPSHTFGPSIISGLTPIPSPPPAEHADHQNTPQTETSVTTNINTSLDISLGDGIINIGDNDAESSADLDPSTLTVTEFPLNGSISVKAGTLTYTPDDGFVGNDQFVIFVCNTDDKCASVAITVVVELEDVSSSVSPLATTTLTMAMLLISVLLQ